MIIPGPDYLPKTLSERQLCTLIDHIIDRAKIALPDHATCSVLLSRTSRELRRQFGARNATIIFRATAKKHTGAVQDEIGVEVPPADYRLSSRDMRQLWDFLGPFITQNYRNHGDAVFTMLLACASKRLQALVGPGGAGVVFQRFADTQQEAATLDL